MAAYGVTKCHVMNATVGGERHIVNPAQRLHTKVVINVARTACASEERLSEKCVGRELSSEPGRPSWCAQHGFGDLGTLPADLSYTANIQATTLLTYSLLTPRTAVPSPQLYPRA
jgi:hypothetical protein